MKSAERWGGTKEHTRWRNELEIFGPEVVRMQLAQSPSGSRAAIAIGATEMDKGFAQEWLGDQLREANRQRVEREQRMIAATEAAVRASKYAAGAAWAAAIATVFVALATGLQAWVAWQQLTVGH